MSAVDMYDIKTAIDEVNSCLEALARQATTEVDGILDSVKSAHQDAVEADSALESALDSIKEDLDTLQDTIKEIAGIANG